jgi:hypothetical protein
MSTNFAWLGGNKNTPVPMLDKVLIDKTNKEGFVQCQMNKCALWVRLPITGGSIDEGCAFALERIQNDNTQKANSHEISSLTNDGACLARAIKDLSTVVDGLLTRLQEVEEKVSRIVQET